MSAVPRAIALTTAIAALAAGPASAAELKVAKPTDLSCGSPTAYPTIQAAVDAARPGDTIKVCPGLYQERVTIQNKDNLKLVSVQHWQAQIKFPSSQAATGAPNAVVAIRNSHNVLLQQFTIEGPWSDTSGCGQAATHEGVRVDMTGSAVIDGNHITQIQDAVSSLRGCQDGIAVRVGQNSAATTGKAEIKNNVIDKYQKNGPTVDGPGSSANIHDNTIDGGGNNNNIATNGIQIGRGATAMVQHNQVFNNYYTGTAAPPPSDNPDDNDATGILVFEVTNGVTIASNTLYGNDLGVEVGVGAMNEEMGFGPTTGVLFGTNTTNANVFDGIRANNDAIGNTFQGNKSSSNGTHDCHDDSAGTGTAGTANTWKDDQGVTQTPAGICKPPK